MTRGRVGYYDFLRGLAILMVVGIHTYPPSSFDSISGSINIVIRQILNSGVPIFLCISGFFLGGKQLDTKKECFNFWKKQIPKVYIPCIVWSLPFFVIALYLGEELKIQIFKLIFGGFGVFYFVILIIQCYLALPVIQKIGVKTSRRGWSLWGGVFCSISVVSAAFIAYYKGPGIPLVIYAGPITTWICFFALGVYLSKAERDYDLKLPVVILILSFIGMLFETGFLMNQAKNGVGIKPSSYVFSISVLLLLFSNKIERWYKESKFGYTIEKVGIYSFGIYLTHMYLITAMNIVHFSESWFLRWVVIVPILYLGMAISKRIFPDFSHKILGF